MTQEKNAIIEFDHVSKVYAGRGKKQTKAVDDVTLSIDEGDIYGIIGYSGAGKSTLVRMIKRPRESDKRHGDGDGPAGLGHERVETACGTTEDRA